MKRCKICNREVSKLRNGMCYKHYMQFKKHGKCLDSNPRTKYDPNEIIIHNDYAEIILYDTNGTAINSTLIDIDDVEKIKDIKWSLRNDYVRGIISSKHIFLHRYLMSPSDDMEVDHINGNPLDNRKCNLRICTHHENLMNQGKCKSNTSGISGVGYRKDRKKWRAYIKVDGKMISLGHYDTKEEAIRARKLGEIKYFGEYRRKEK